MGPEVTSKGKPILDIVSHNFLDTRYGCDNFDHFNYGNLCYVYSLSKKLGESRKDNMSNDSKKYFIIEEKKWQHNPIQYEVKYSKMFSLEEAMSKTFHLNALNEDETIMFYLQEVNLVNSTKPYKETEKLINGSVEI